MESDALSVVTRRCKEIPALPKLLRSPSAHLDASSLNEMRLIQGRSRFQPRLTHVEGRSLPWDLQQTVLDPFKLIGWPDPRSDLASDQSQRDRTVVPRVSRPGVIVARYPAVAFRNLRRFRHV